MTPYRARNNHQRLHSALGKSPAASSMTHCGLYCPHKVKTGQNGFEDNPCGSQTSFQSGRTVEAMCDLAVVSNDVVHMNSIFKLAGYEPPRYFRGKSDNCFAADTPILLPDGTSKYIQDIQVGDIVLSYDVSREKLVAKQVTSTWSGPHADMYIINDEIHVTSEHPFWTIETGWASISPTELKKKHNMDSAKLEVGLHLLASNGSHIQVDSIKSNYGEVITYNFGVENTNTYFANGILVHNKPGNEGPSEGVNPAEELKIEIETSIQNNQPYTGRIPPGITVTVDNNGVSITFTGNQRISISPDGTIDAEHVVIDGVPYDNVEGLKIEKDGTVNYPPEDPNAPDTTTPTNPDDPTGTPDDPANAPPLPTTGDIISADGGSIDLDNAHIDDSSFNIIVDGNNLVAGTITSNVNGNTIEIEDMDIKLDAGETISVSIDAGKVFIQTGEDVETNLLLAA